MYAVRSYERIRGDAVPDLHDRRHSLQINLVHDTVAGWNHIDVFKSRFSPVNKVKLFVGDLQWRDLFKCVGVKARMLNRQRVVNNKLGRYNRINLGRVAAFNCNGITQTRKIHKRGLTKNVVTQRGLGTRESRALVWFRQSGSNSLLKYRYHGATSFPRYLGVLELVMLEFDVFNGLPGIEEIEIGAWRFLTVIFIHAVFSQKADVSRGANFTIYRRRLGAHKVNAQKKAANAALLSLA